MSDLTKVHIEETATSRYSATINVSNHVIHVDEPNSFEGGGDSGPAPFDLLVSSLAACTVMTMRWYAEQKNIPLEHAEADISFDRKNNHFIKHISVFGNDLTDEQKNKLIDVAGKCPVNKVLAGGITTKTLLAND